MHGLHTTRLSRKSTLTRELHPVSAPPTQSHFPDIRNTLPAPVQLNQEEEEEGAETFVEVVCRPGFVFNFRNAQQYSDSPQLLSASRKSLLIDSFDMTGVSQYASSNRPVGDFHLYFNRSPNSLSNILLFEGHYTTKVGIFLQNLLCI